MTISPSSATVALEQSLPFTASFSGAPFQAITWSVNNTPGGDTSVGTISNSPSQNGLYLAPVNMPAARQVTISAANTADPTLSGSATLQLTSNIQVSISPSSATRVPEARQTFSASVAQTSNPQVGWTVNGIPNGNAAFGQICLPASSPCQPPPLATAPGAVDYLAPAAVPNPAQVTVEAVSAADPARFAAATITVVPQISVVIAPPSLTLPPGQVQTFAATVLGAADQNVTWDVGGSINGSIADGLICLPASDPCQAPNGAFAGAVEYRAPATVPVPNVVILRATSQASPPAQAITLVTISTAPFITGIVPASVFAGAAGSFGLRVMGVQLAASQPGPGTTIVINGVPRASNCPSANECDTTLDPADVAAPGALAVSVETSDAPPTTGNTVSLSVAAPLQTTSVIPLDSTVPAAAGVDIYVVEPTVAGSDPPDQMSLLAVGLVDAASGTCSLAAPPLVLPRPATGSATFRLCVFGTALNEVARVNFFSLSPETPDIAATNLQTPTGGLSLEFDAVLSATAAPGPRTLFAVTPNLDQVALTAAVEIQ